MKYLAILLIVFVFSKAHSQSSILTSKIVFGIHAAEGILYFSDLSGINNVLNANNLPSLKTYMPVSNSGISFGVNRFLFQFNQRLYQLNNKEAGTYSLSSDGEGYDVKFGYDLLKSNKFRLYPFVGLGEQNLTWIIDKQSPIGLDDAIKTNSRQSHYLSIDKENIGYVGLIFDLNVFSFCRKRIDFLVGGNLEYLYSSESGNWRLNDQITNVGDINISGFSWMIKFSMQANLTNKNK